ncbi:hypothetical protein BT96DRAFT_133107 [Gymnopus androsaceus JB14]|uniref:Uncharacterized protein n=1 Tax=Gymnopus androsaceus JB14 TaxID=1447944 RepID=A0A6A4IF76_9AGAR|nr:hypothetical protein BT96DRAFT_133107 [Gymnopus androsaceus JB14]
MLRRNELVGIKREWCIGKKSIRTPWSSRYESKRGEFTKITLSLLPGTSIVQNPMLKWNKPVDVKREWSIGKKSIRTSWSSKYESKRGELTKITSSLLPVPLLCKIRCCERNESGGCKTRMDHLEEVYQGSLELQE